MSTWIRGAVLAALLGGGCASTYYPARFTPAPLEVRLAADGQGQARALVSVRGIRRGTRAEPARAEMAMRLENMGTGTLRLREESLRLLSADLGETFGPGLVVSGDPAQGVPPGGEASYQVHFPLAAGQRVEDLDLRGLNLRWTVSFEGQDVTTGITFERVHLDPYGPGPRTTFGLGIGIRG